MTISHSETRSVPLSALVLSQTPIQIERRAQFDQTALKELSATIKATGRVEQAITVRPVAGKAERFEIADGERRVIGSQMAGLADILAEVRPLSDEQVEQIQIVTGLQKEGLHELVEAEGYETLQKRGLSVEEIAAKCGKTKATIYARMKLLALCPEARKQLRGAQISASVALLIARIPLEKLQKEALKAITTRAWPHMEGMSYREAADFVQREYMLRLDQAPFKTGDATLVPKAGACGACPKNTSCQPELFADVTTKALCTDPGCFAEKKAAANARKIEEAKASGQVVITGKDAKKIAGHGAHSIGGGYERLDAMCTDDPQRRTYKQLLGKSAKPALVEASDGTLVEVVNEIEALKQLKANGVIKPVKLSTSARTQATSSKAANEKMKRTQQLDDELENRLYLAIHAKAPKVLPRATLDFLVEETLDIHGILHDGLLKAWGWEDVPIKSELKKLSDSQMSQLLFELVATADRAGGGVEATAKLLKVDIKKIRAEVAAAFKLPPPAKASKKAVRK